MHKVERIDREVVVDEEGRSYPIKEVLPVPEGSTEPKLVGRGLSVARQAKGNVLGGARAELENVLEGLGGQATAGSVSRRPRESTDFFEQLAREGVSRQKPIDASVALWPDVFEPYGSSRDRGIKLKSS